MVFLIGFSFFVRVIYICLMVLVERCCFGFVDFVVMMGFFVLFESRVWLILKSVVIGCLVNVYFENDYIFGFLCCILNIYFGIVGLEGV